MEIQEPEIFRRHRAYHEAGHVIADLVLGYRFAFVTIRPDESAEYEGVVYGSTRGRARDLAVIQLAGIVASAQTTGRNPWENPDQFDDDSADIAAANIFIDNWIEFLSRTFGDSSYRKKLWDEIDNKTRLLVHDNQKSIEVIAGALLEQETLTYNDVIRMVKAECPGFNTGEKR